MIDPNNPLERPQRKIDWDFGVLPGHDPITEKDFFAAVAEDDDGVPVWLGNFDTAELAEKALDQYNEYQSNIPENEK